MKKYVITLTLLFSVCLSSSFAQAESYKFDGLGVGGFGYGIVYDIARDDGGRFIVDNAKVAGSLLFSSSTHKVTGWVLDPMNAYHANDWITKPHNLSKSGQNAESLLGTEKYGLITSLINVLYPKIESDPRFQFVLQLAIFETMVNDKFGVSGADNKLNFWGFTVSEQFTGLSFKWIDNQLAAAYQQVLNRNYTETIKDFFIIQGDNGESPILAFNDISPTATPIPGAALLLGTGIAGIIATRRRINQNPV